jgi:hypothetical protein
VITDLIGELRIDVDYIIIEQAREQVVAQENVVEILRIPLEDVGVALILRQRFNQGMQDTSL